MTINKESITNPNQTEEEEKIIFRSFLRRLEKEKNQERWEKILADEYDLPRPAGEVRRPAVLRRILLPIVGIAATVLLLIFALPLLLAPGSSDLLAEYQADLMVVSYRAQANAPADRLREELIASFTDGNYTKAQELGRSLLQENDAQAIDLLNLGLAYLKNNDFSAAETTFLRLRNAEEDYQTEATFYLALSLLQQEKTEEGLNELESISPTDGTKIYDKAQALLRANRK